MDVGWIRCGDLIMRAEARYIRISPQKARLVVDLIRGRSADSARLTLRAVNKRVAPTVLKEVVVGEILVRDVPAIVHPDTRFQGSLLGMSFLSRLSQFEVMGGRLILKP